MDRPLSPLENFMWLLDQGASQNFVMVARVSGNLTEPVLRQALDLMQKKYPPLCARIDPLPSPRFVSEGVPPIPLRIIEKKDDNHWINEAETEMPHLLPWKQGPFVRVLKMDSKENCDLLVTFCHVLFDATSAVLFLKDLLTFSSGLIRGETIAVTTALPTLPSVLDLLKPGLKFKPSFLYIPTQVKLALYKKANLPPDPANINGNGETVGKRKNMTRIIQRTLSKAESKKIMTRSRKEKTTVHGTLSASMLQTLVEQIRKFPGYKQKGPLFIGCITPLNMRNACKIPVGDNMGNFITDAIHYQSVDDSSPLMEASRAVENAFRRELDFNRHIKLVIKMAKLLEKTSDPSEIAKSIDISFPSVGVTNMGVLDIPETFGDLVLEKIHFSPAIDPVVKFGLSICSFRGDVTLNFLYLDPWIPREKAYSMAESVVKRLKDAINRG